MSSAELHLIIDDIEHLDSDWSRAETERYASFKGVNTPHDIQVFLFKQLLHVFVFKTNIDYTVHEIDKDGFKLCLLQSVSDKKGNKSLTGSTLYSINGLHALFMENIKMIVGDEYIKDDLEKCMQAEQCEIIEWKPIPPHHLIYNYHYKRAKLVVPSDVDESTVVAKFMEGDDSNLTKSERGFYEQLRKKIGFLARILDRKALRDLIINWKQRARKMTCTTFSMEDWMFDTFEYILTARMKPTLFLDYSAPKFVVKDSLDTLLCISKRKNDPRMYFIEKARSTYVDNLTLWDSADPNGCSAGEIVVRALKGKMIPMYWRTSLGIVYKIADIGDRVLFQNYEMCGLNYYSPLGGEVLLLVTHRGSVEINHKMEQIKLMSLHCHKSDILWLYCTACAFCGFVREGMSQLKFRNKLLLRDHLVRHGPPALCQEFERGKEPGIHAGQLSSRRDIYVTHDNQVVNHGDGLCPAIIDKRLNIIMRRSQISSGKDIMCAVELRYSGNVAGKFEQVETFNDYFNEMKEWLSTVYREEVWEMVLEGAWRTTITERASMYEHHGSCENARRILRNNFSPGNFLVLAPFLFEPKVESVDLNTFVICGEEFYFVIGINNRGHFQKVENTNSESSVIRVSGSERMVHFARGPRKEMTSIRRNKVRANRLFNTQPFQVALRNEILTDMMETAEKEQREEKRRMLRKRRLDDERRADLIINFEDDSSSDEEMAEKEEENAGREEQIDQSAIEMAFVEPVIINVDLEEDDLGEPMY